MILIELKVDHDTIIFSDRNQTEFCVSTNNELKKYDVRIPETVSKIKMQNVIGPNQTSEYQVKREINQSIERNICR